MPRSPAPRNVPGQANLRGKKSRLCSCGCCVVLDMREDYEKKRVTKEDMHNTAQPVLSFIENILVDTRVKD